MSEINTVVSDKPKRDYVADHARRTLRAAGLTKQEAKVFVAAVQEFGHRWCMRSQLRMLWISEAQPHLDLSKLSRKLPDGVKLSQLLCDSFPWGPAEAKFGIDFGYLFDHYSEKELNPNA